jgi:hypothetical protein
MKFYDNIDTFVYVCIVYVLWYTCAVSAEVSSYYRDSLVCKTEIIYLALYRKLLTIIEVDDLS